MSFPNSGTSFTLRLIQRSSQLVAGTNYGKEHYPNGTSVPMHSNFSDGPFWLKPGPQNNYPTNYVLTKTHCGGRCNNCGPSRYLENPTSFLKQCLMAERAYMVGDTVKIHKVPYTREIVDKAIHLFRNPIDNVVSRFHNELDRRRRNDRKGVKLFPKTREGFREFCEMQNELYSQDEQTYFESDVMEAIKSIPCRADFVRYAQWHDLATIVTDYILKIPTYILHYEHYSTTFNETLQQLLGYLEMDQQGQDAEFIPGKEYSHYFTPQERAAIKVAMQRLASSRTWANIQHYFN